MTFMKFLQLLTFFQKISKIPLINDKGFVIRRGTNVECSDTIVSHFHEYDLLDNRPERGFHSPNNMQQPIGHLAN